MISGVFTNSLKKMDGKQPAQNVWRYVVAFSRKAGRAGARIVLKFYYTLQYGDLSASEKAMVYAGIVYLVVPHDLLPRKFLGLFGMLDDVGVAAWIFKRINKHITPEIERRVDATLDKWFGPVVTIGYAE